jgi:hypothetical protein
MRREQPAAELYLLDAGHFAINDCPDDIAGYVRAFVRTVNAWRPRPARRRRGR